MLTDPGSGARGLHRARIAIGTILVAMMLSAVPSAFGATTSWEFDATNYDFGQVAGGGGPTEPHEFVLTNTGDTSITISTRLIAWRGAAPLDPHTFLFTQTDCRAMVTLEPGQTCSADVAFNPLTGGPKEGHFSIKAANEEPPAATVQ